MAVPSPSGNGDWFYNKNTGQIQHITNFFQKAAFEIMTWEVPFDTQADAQAYKTAYEAHKANPKTTPDPTKSWWLNPEDGTISGPLPPSQTFSSPWMSFATKAEAEAYLKAHPPTYGLGGNPLAGLSDIAKVLGSAWNGISDGKMWRSLGWVIGGVLLLLVGVALWVKSSLNPLKALV